MKIQVGDLGCDLDQLARGAGGVNSRAVLLAESVLGALMLGAAGSLVLPGRHQPPARAEEHPDWSPNLGFRFCFGREKLVYTKRHRPLKTRAAIRRVLSFHLKSMFDLN